MFRTLLMGALALSTVLAVAAPASAQSIAMYGEEGRNVIALKYADADIHTARGAKSLALRVRVAAAQVCGGDNLVVRTGEQFARCREAAIDRAIASLNAPMLADALGRAPRALASGSR